MQGDSAHPAPVDKKEKMKSGGRPKKLIADRRVTMVAARFDSALLKRLDAFCRLSENNRAQVVRLAVKEYLERSMSRAA
jgi:Ribbon-helix-helix protein, copG family